MDMPQQKRIAVYFKIELNMKIGRLAVDSRRSHVIAPAYRCPSQQCANPLPVTPALCMLAREDRSI